MSDIADEAVLSQELQGGTLSVHEDRVEFDRSSRSNYEDKTIPMDEIVDVDFSGGLMAGYIQIVQAGVKPDRAGFLSKPVNENTMYFSRSIRDDAAELRDEILFRASGPAPAKADH